LQALRHCPKASNKAPGTSTKTHSMSRLSFMKTLMLVMAKISSLVRGSSFI